MDGRRRFNLHTQCDQLGIHHTSTGGFGVRELHLYKPPVWLWEFSAPNPYSEATEVYQQRHQEKQEQIRNRIARKRCTECGANGIEAELFESPYLNGYYCESDGGVLGDHKFEPIN